MKITDRDVRYIAELANLRLSDDEVKKCSADLAEILTYVEKLNEVDTSKVNPMAQVLFPGDETITLRDDAPRDSLPLGTALDSAPTAGAGHFKVPKVIER